MVEKWFQAGVELYCMMAKGIFFVMVKVKRHGVNYGLHRIIHVSVCFNLNKRETVLIFR